MSGLKWIIIFILCIAILAAVGVFFIPAKELSPLSFSLMVAMAVFFMGASFIFLRSLQGFTPQLKRAYRLLCIGLALLALAQVQLPIGGIVGVSEEFWYASIGQPLIYIVAIFTIFAGTRAFARLFDIRNLSTSWIFSFCALTLLGVIVILLPHAPTTFAESDFDTINAASLIAVVFIFLATSHIWQIRRVASNTYTNALFWLFVSLGLTTFGGIFYIFFRLITGENEIFIIYNPLIIGSAFALSGLALLRAAYSFATIQIDKTPFSTAGSASSIDIITFTAGLASDTRAIDPILDRMRLITANRLTNSQLSPAEEKILLEVYLELEHYLVEKERVRHFTQAALRQKIAQQLRLTHNQQLTFWPKLPPMNKPLNE